MNRSENYNFYLPSNDTDDIADINQISDNFRIIDETIPSKTDLDNIKIDIDQTYNPESANAQSGKAVAEAADACSPAIVITSGAVKTLVTTDSSESLIKGLSAYGESSVKYIDISENLISYPFKDTTKTVNGITFTDNGDGTITANGTATASVNFVVTANEGLVSDIMNKTMRLSGCPAGGSMQTYWMAITAGPGIANDIGNGQVFTLKNTMPLETYSIMIYVFSGKTVNNLVFSPSLVEVGETKISVESPAINVNGKNLFDKSISFDDYNIYQGGYRYIAIYVGIGTTVTVSVIKKYNPGERSGYFYCTAFKIEEGEIFPESNKKWIYSNTVAGLCNKSQTMVSENGYISLLMNPNSYNAFKDEILVEINSAATAYEPYLEPQTVTLPYTFAEADTLTVKDGTVKINISGEESDITDTETGQALLALKTNYPITTVISDIDLDITYKADTKNYIDNKIAVLTAMALEG